MTDTEHQERRRGQLYGRRKGPRLSAYQQDLRETLLPQLALRLQSGSDPRVYFSPPPCGEVEARSVSGGGPLAPSGTAPHPKNRVAPLCDFSTSPQGGGDFTVADVWLEVGYGGGEHLHWQAEQHPDIGLLGAEPYESGTAKLLSRLAEHPLPNIRLYENDARDIIDALPDASIGRFFLLFPDPWPKTRHHKRRFLQMEMLDRLARILKPGAELRFASDDAGYLAYALERLAAHPAFRWTATGPSDWHTRPADWPPTRYEAKELHGPPAFLRFVRR
ncbi:MAG: tRNA (guanine(46)-N(7))-methyltransferase TrmB [Rhizomicrobium sp.]